MLKPCQCCGTPTSVLIVDYFCLRTLLRDCFGEIVETNQIPPRLLATVPVRDGLIQGKLMEKDEIILVRPLLMN